MDYGNKAVAKRRAKIASKKAIKKKKRGFVRFFKAFLIFSLIVVATLLVAAVILVKQIIDDAPDITADDIKPQAHISTVYADDGQTQLDTFVDAGSNRIDVKIDKIPVDLQNAVIAVEDSRFRDHNGVDIRGILRAGVTGLTNGGFTQGGSTITQQLIKNSIFPDFMNETRLQKIKRKIQEIYLAVKIEKEIGDKDVILEDYLNTINLGQNCLGVQAASLRYFGKDVSKLTLSESATIAGITQSPERYNPITNPDENAKRRKKVLEDMLDQGYVTEKEYNEAIDDDVYSRIQVTNTTYTEAPASVNSYFVDEVAKQVMRDLVNKLGFNETQAHNAVYSGGLKIVSTQDLEMQKICDEELNNPANYPSKVKWGVTCAVSVIKPDGTQTNYDHYDLANFMKEKYGAEYGMTFASEEEANARFEEFAASLNTDPENTVMKRISVTPQPQASMVIMDQHTGEVKAIFGGRGEKKESMSLNRATQSARQPGSCFKVLSTYVPALDAHGDTLATVIRDSPFTYDDGKQVNNWWGNYYRGNMTIRDCITVSANVCTVKKLTEITPALGFRYLTENFSMTTLSAEKDMYQAMALGGISKGVYNLEMTAAYASIANGGVYNEPIFYKQIYDQNGNLLYENIPETHVAMKESTAFLITSAMQDVINDGSGTGKAAKLSNMPAAGKTGTSQECKDLWFSAFTPYLTASVWTGYDDSQPMEDYWDQSFHERLWKNVMQRIHEDYEKKDFEMPEGIEKKRVCARSGKLATTSACSAYTEYFAEGTAPKQGCPGH